MATHEHKEIIEEFLKETKGHLEKLEEKFLQARACAQEGIPVGKEDLNEIFQAAHTIKGTASLVGLSRIVSVAHELAALFRGIRGEDMVFTADIVDMLFNALDALKALMKDLNENGRETMEVEEVIAKMKESPKPQAVAQDKSGNGVKNEKKTLAAFPDIDEKYLEVYLDDTERNIESFNHDLVALEKDPANMDLINNLFRLMHTIKGSSGMVNVTPVQKVAHAMENVFSMVRDRKEAFADMFSLFFEGIDVISALISSLRHRQPLTTDIEPVLREFEEYVQGLGAGKGDTKKKSARAHPIVQDPLETAASSRGGRKLLTEAIDRKNKVYRIMLSMEETTPLKSMKAMVIEEHLKAKGTIITMNPNLESIDDAAQGILKIGILFVSVLKEKEILPLISVGEVDIVRVELIDIEVIKEVLARVSEAAEAVTSPEKDREKKEPAGGGGSPSQAAAIRIDARKLDTLMNLSGELVTVRAQFERLVALLQSGTSFQREFARVIPGLKLNFQFLSKDVQGFIGKQKEYDSKRILNQLSQMELHLDQMEKNASWTNLTSEIHSLDEMTGILGKIASDIQTAVMQARMVPIKGVFSRFNRIVRDIAKDLGKDVNLVLEGEETELDKNLVDSLGEPLTHMVRNAIGHGIEDPATRRKSGKPGKGTIRLRAFHDGNNVCIEVADDGKGLDPEVLGRSALAKKLVTEEQLNRLTQREKLDLMFLPGFSTAAKVTDLSGRGVGMDVVRNMIVAMNGAIDIASEVGMGTTFILKIPLTLAIIQALLIVVDGETYALPLEAVTEIIKITKDMIYSIDGNDTIKLREQVLSLVELRDVIYIKGAEHPPQDVRRVVVISDGNSQVGIMVDEMIGETEIVIKSLTHHFFNVKGISGVTILGDGRISLILDPKLIIMQSR